MRFLDAMEDANLNFGMVDSPDFAVCYLDQKGDHSMFIGGQTGTYEFKKEDISIFKVVASGGTKRWHMD